MFVEADLRVLKGSRRAFYSTCKSDTSTGIRYLVSKSLMVTLQQSISSLALVVIRVSECQSSERGYFPVITLLMTGYPSATLLPTITHSTAIQHNNTEERGEM
jgi:hypothetical protein